MRTPCRPAGFLGGSLYLSADGTWEMTIHFDREEPGDSRALEDFGEYDQEGEDLFFVSQAYGDEFDGTLEGGAVVITYDFDGDGEYETDFTFVE